MRNDIVFKASQPLTNETGGVADGERPIGWNATYENTNAPPNPTGATSITLSIVCLR